MRELAGLALVTVIARRNLSAGLYDAVRGAFACELPNGPGATRAGDIQFLWCGPHTWLARAEAQLVPNLIERMADAIGRHAALTGQSDGRAVVRLSGPRARDSLAKLCAIDLHPRSFGRDSVALTNIAHLSGILWQVDEMPMYEISVFRSFAIHLYEGIITASAEFGCEVLAQK
jgi:heterotetrameric sarcosine oxidase gamma subunit